MKYLCYSVRKPWKKQIPILTNDKIIIFDEEIPVKFSSSVRCCITIGKITNSNEKFVVQKHTTYFQVTLVR